MANTNGTNGTNAHADSHPHLRALVSSAPEFLSTNYDYVIIGGGTAGLTLAARLTENPDVTVGVLEAGKDRLGDPLVDTPAMFLQMLGNPDYDWMLKTTPQDHNGRKRVHHMPRGKVLGGSSAINYMMYVRGSDADFDDWAELVDDPSWSAAAMKPYMRKHQTLEPIDPSIKDRSTMPFVGEHHGTSGPVRTSFNTTPPLPIETDLIRACDEVAGLTKKPLDPWSGDHIGFFNTLGAVVRSGPNKGKRSYAARGYLEANAGRPNLKVLCEAFVTRIVLEGDTAVGVEFTHSGEQHTVSATREVLVCGGTIFSPQILELSGIGDPKVLEAAGVECKISNPAVGNNFQDHAISGLGFELTPGNLSMDAIYQPEVMEDAQKALIEAQGGPLTGISSTQGFIPFKSIASDEELAEVVKSIQDTPAKTEFQRKQLEKVVRHLESDISANLQLVFIPATGNVEEGVEDQSKIFPPPSRPDQPMGIFAVMCLQYPVARGSIHITSSDPFTQPAIDPAYNGHPADTTVMGAGLRFLDKVAKTSILAPKLGKRTTPTNASLDLQDLAQANQAVRDYTMGEYHPAGSCAMGDALDSKLKVKGVRKLRVVDASVFPNHVSGNIVSSVYMVAERAADLIKEEWDYSALDAMKGKTMARL